MVKIKACKKATSNSNTLINKTNATETGAMAKLLKIKINDTKLNTIMCPAVMLANKRIIKAKGLENIPMISTTHMMGNNQKGTSGLKIWLQ